MLQKLLGYLDDFPPFPKSKIRCVGLGAGGFFGWGAWHVGRQGAFERPFDGDPDEAAHFVTGLMIRDYLASGLATDPVTYAQRYYGSYPKVAFGVWPPLFHLAEGLWLFSFGPSRLAALSLSVFAIACASLLLFLSSAAQLGWRLACGASLLLLALPGVLSGCGIVLADPLCVPLSLGAAWCFNRFLERGAWQDSMAFGLLSALALLTKYNSFALAFVPIFAIAFTRQWSLWRSWRLWMAPVVVVAVAGPWYAMNWKMVVYAADMGAAAVPPVWEAGLANVSWLGQQTGWPAAALALYGAWVSVSRFRAQTAWGATLAALVASVWLMHTVLYPIPGARYMLPAAPALVFLAAFGWKHLPDWRPLRGAVAAAVLLTLAPAWQSAAGARNSWKTTAQTLKELR